MKVLRLCEGIKGVVLDNDGTLHGCAAYIEEGRQKELQAIAVAKELSSKEASRMIKERRLGLQQQLGKPPTLTEVIATFGLSAPWWNEARLTCYRPEVHLLPNLELVQEVALLADTYRVAIASNNPRELTRRALMQLGFSSLLDRILVIGPEDAETSKANPYYFSYVAARMGLRPENVVSVGDREEADGIPAMAAGMAAILVDDPRDTLLVCEMLRYFDQPFDPALYLRWTTRDVPVSIHGITGQAGAGKSTFATVVDGECAKNSIPHAALGLDTFFRLSSRERKHWLAEARGMSIEEYQRRADQMTWWDFDRVGEAIETLRSGKTLHLQGVYNRAEGGELTGVVHIEPEENMRITMEGVALAHLASRFDSLTMFHARAHVRKERLMKRDSHRQGREIDERWNVTEGFEKSYFTAHGRKAHLHVDNSDGTPLLLRSVPPQHYAHKLLV